MILQSWKEIAAYVSSKVGARSVKTCMRYSHESENPLPVRAAPGSVIAETEEIDRWIGKRWKPRNRAAG